MARCGGLASPGVMVGRRVRRSCGPIIVAGAVSLLVAGCGLAPGPGAVIAERIRAANSPIVREVVFSPHDWVAGNPEEITVYLVREVTDAQAQDLWCNVMIPAGAEQLLPDRIQLRKGGEVVEGGARLLGDKVVPSSVCPGDSSTVPSG